MKMQKTKLRHRVLALALALMLCVSMLNLTAFATEGELTPIPVEEVVTNPEPVVEPETVVESTESSDPVDPAGEPTKEQPKTEKDADNADPKVEEPAKEPVEGTPAEKPAEKPVEGTPAEEQQPAQQPGATETTEEVGEGAEVVAGVVVTESNNVLPKANVMAMANTNQTINADNLVYVYLTTKGSNCTILGLDDNGDANGPWYNWGTITRGNDLRIVAGEKPSNTTDSHTGVYKDKVSATCTIQKSNGTTVNVTRDAFEWSLHTSNGATGHWPKDTPHTFWHLDGKLRQFTVTYKDGADGSAFADDPHPGLIYGETTPEFVGGTPTREGYKFLGWDKEVAKTVTADATYVAHWEPIPDPVLTGITKDLVTREDDVPAGLNVSNITYPNNDGEVVIPKDGEVTLLYRITVTGDEGASYVVTDTDATLVSGAWSGTIPEGGSAVIYVTKEFNAESINDDGDVVNTAEVRYSEDDEDPFDDAEATTPAEKEPEATTYTVYHVYNTNGKEDNTVEEVKSDVVGAVITIANLVQTTHNNNTYTHTSTTPSDKPTIELVLDATKNVITLVYNRQIPVISISKTADRDKVPVGETVTFTIKVTNSGQADASVLVADQLPAGLALVKSEIPTEEVTVAAGVSLEYKLTAEVTQAGSITNVAIVTDEDGKPLDDAEKEITGLGKVTLSYNAMGGDPTPASETKVLENGKATFTVSTDVPTREGYVFKGWQKGTNVVTGEITIEKDTTLYAQWEKEPEVTDPPQKEFTLKVIYEFYLDGVKQELLTRVAVDEKMPENATYDVVVAPTLDGYTTTEESKLNQTLTKDTIVVVEYCKTTPAKPEEPKTMIVQWLDGYSSGTKNLIKRIEIPEEDSYENPADPTREGYDFTAWSEPEESTNGFGQKVITFIAQWTEKTPEETSNPTPPTPRTLTVNKVWVGDEDAGVRPDSIQVQLYLSGAAYGSPVTLSAGNGWSYTWIGLPAAGTLTVEELNIPEGYEAATSISGSNVTITNTYTDEEIEDPDVPLGPGPGEPTPTPTPAPSEKPTPGPSATPDPDEDIEDPDVPLGPGPEDPDDPDEEIPDENVPLGTPKPVEPSEPDDGEEIPDEKVPLANTPKTGDDSRIWMTLALISAAGLVFLGISRRKKGENVR